MLAGSLALLLMAQAGIPFTTGFLAKFEVISGSVDAGSTALAVVAMISAAIAAFFYLRVILYMYTPVSALGVARGEVGAISAGGVEDLGDLEGEARGEDASGGDHLEVEQLHPRGGTQLAIELCVGVTVLFGIWPAPVLDFAHHAGLLFISH